MSDIIDLFVPRHNLCDKTLSDYMVVVLIHFNSNIPGMLPAKLDL